MRPQGEVPAPDPALPPSFDGEQPAHRYRFVESANSWAMRPIMESHGWDHESGIDGFSMEKPFVLEDVPNQVLPRKRRLRSATPANIAGQVTKNKNEAQVQLEAEASVKHAARVVSTAGMDVQTVGQDVAYTARAETRWKNRACNKTAAGVSVAKVAGCVAKGVKVENRLKIRPGTKLVVSAGVIEAKKDKAMGANAELMLGSKDPSSTTRHSVGGSLMHWRNDTALGVNGTSQFNLTDDTSVTVRANVNSRGQGQLTTRFSTNEKLSLSGVGLIPLLATLVPKLLGRGDAFD